MLAGSECIATVEELFGRVITGALGSLVLTTGLTILLALVLLLFRVITGTTGTLGSLVLTTG